MARTAPFFSLGPGTHPVPMSLHAENRQRLCERLKAGGADPAGVVLLQGGKLRNAYDTDREELFRQESFFRWAFGVKEADFFGAIEVGTGRSWLFAPRLPEAWAVWMGKVHPPAHFQQVYEVDEVRYVDELAATLAKLDPQPLCLLRGQNTDSGSFTEPAHFDGIEKFDRDLERLHPEIVECRVIKTPAELELLRFVNGVSNAAHVEVMKRIRPGISEYQLEALFLHEIYTKGGCRFTAYTCICGCGPNSATLHYGHSAAPNDRVLQDGDLFLNDSGAEYHGYASDVTCTSPVNGIFTPAQRAVYETVLRANLAVQNVMKPGVLWPDMHRLAERTILEGLLQMGLVKGTLEDLAEAHAAALFMPHGLGHFMGLDVHDPGGYPKGVERIDEPGIRSLRAGRRLQAGMVITVEPGLYFIDALLEPALADPKTDAFLNKDLLRQFVGFGGVRIEDDVLVTEHGCENLTRVPRTVDEIEHTIAEGRRSRAEVLAMV